jgi:hypothetical protein
MAESEEERRGSALGADDGLGACRGICKLSGLSMVEHGGASEVCVLPRLILGAGRDSPLASRRAGTLGTRDDWRPLVSTPQQRPAPGPRLRERECYCTSLSLLLCCVKFTQTCALLLQHAPAWARRPRREQPP